jgi:Tfp pilus assembly protein FimV
MSDIENTPTESAPAQEGAEQAPTEQAPAEQAPAEQVPTEQVPAEEITYHAVEKDGQVTAIWEMQGRKHVRTIDPRSRQGQEILRLYTSDHHDEPVPQETGEAVSN